MFKKTSSVSYDDRLGLTLRDTGEAVSKFLAELPAEPTGFERVAAIVPAQTLAPLKFEVDNGVLKLRRETAAVNKIDEQNVVAARTELGKAGAELAAYLAASNYDRALINVVEEMRERIEQRDNVIQLGLFALSFSMIVDAAQEELPPLWHAKMKAYSIGVGMFVSQHPVWVTFSENSMKAEFNPNDAKVLQQNGRELITELRKSRGLVDEDVPRSLSYLLDAISDRARPTARALFAAVTSIGNLVAAVTRGFGSILVDYGKSAHEGVKEAVQTVSNLAAKTLLLGAVGALAMQLSPISARVLHSEWMRDVGEYLSKQAVGEGGKVAD